MPMVNGFIDVRKLRTDHKLCDPVRIPLRPKLSPFTTKLAAADCFLSKKPRVFKNLSPDTFIGFQKKRFVMRDFILKIPTHSSSREVKTTLKNLSGPT